MAGTIVKIKQSSVAGRLPTHDTAASTDIVQGELALNTADKKLYSKDSSGTVFEIGAGSGGAAGANEIITTEFTTSASSTTTFSVAYNASNDHVNVYFNGVWLPPSDFTATNGTTVVLDSAAVAGTEVVIQVIKALNLANGSDITEYEFTASANQTTFAISGGYVTGTSDIEVYVNGVKIPSADFTATNDTQIVLGSAAAVNDQVAVRVVRASLLTSAVNQTSPTGAGVLPIGTTAQRPGSPLAGYLRWNSTLHRTEVYNNNTSAWGDVTPTTQQVTVEEIQDAIGLTITGNTETGIAVTYDDAGNKLNFVVASQTANDFTNTLKTKLDAIEASATADQTSADIRGLVAIDEDNFSSNSDTKLPTQQSIKAYVDAQVATVPVGDITSVVAGTGLTGGGTSGAATVNVIGGTGITANANDIAIDSTVATLTGSQTLTNKTLSATAFTGAITTNSTIDTRDVATDGTKLDGIEASATADQTNAEIKAAVEAASDSNTFTDADHSKLNAIEASATADQTGAQIKTAYEGQTSAFTDAQFSKLAAIEASATADQSNAEIRAAVEAASDSNAFTNADHTKLNAVEALADVTDSTNVVAALTAGTGVTISSGGTIAVGPVALTTVQTASSQSAHLALTVQEGDVVIRSDENKSYMRNGLSAGDMTDFTLLATPTDVVLSVAGNVGVVTNAHIAAAVEAASGSNTFTDADHTKLNNIETAADVTDATNVTAAGALMDSELAGLAAVKATTGTFLTADQTKLDAIEASATADQTGAQIKTAYQAETNAFTDAQFTKLSNIETAADVTDATNVNAAGALMLSDTTTAGLGIVLDEDNMGSNSATKLSTQQAIKAYVDAQIQTVPDAVAMSIALG